MVKIPNTLAIMEAPFESFKYVKNGFRNFKSISFSWPFRVLIINLLSDEKKKKEPLAPAPCPALNTFFLFKLDSRD